MRRVKEIYVKSHIKLFLSFLVHSSFKEMKHSTIMLILIKANLWDLSQKIKNKINYSGLMTTVSIVFEFPLSLN